ncbi:C40 family peptidase [Lactiplantibacillus xiangfangensis]|uniref:Extracellular protein, gamma-d-glutamate-meso-dia minopimelate muropeptidase n=1 Tax=Lactiplantibacillus xiangfangensis TaxID=942150 RepID=A0A0R2MV61_9LACO|nr:NlpC/P60 family protein [Lactiplantibacillus xiangfangensis]KRO14602.1 extracellular protein, gamma-d-glutamate-meso-dia minopimelate muropeptidase [Lactiplantibacillus xiangfangensis]
MKQRLIALIIASLGLVFGLWQAPTAYAKATHQVISTTKVSKTGYMKKANNTAIYKMHGAANNTKIKKIGTLSTYGNPTWFVTKKRQVLTNGKVKKYYYVTKSDKKVKGWVRTYTVKKSKKSFTNLYKVAKSKLGHRYVYGAVGPTTFDCSGYTRYCFNKAAKKSLPRVAQSQYSAYKKVSSRTAKKGDLVFFGSSTGSISHVGIYVGGGKMIDAQNSGVKNERVYVPWWHAVGYSRPVNFKA